MSAKTIGIISIKGGVGKTVTTCNIGTALAEIGKKVLVVDADFTSPSVGLHLGIVSPKQTLHHVLKGHIEAHEAVHEYNENLHVLPSSLSGRRNINPFKLREKIKGLKEAYDYILIDSSPTLNDHMLSTIVASDELLVVTSPDYPTLSATLHAVQVAKKQKTPIVGLVLNRVRGKRFELTRDEIEETAGIPIVGVVKDDIHVPASIAKTIPTLTHKPRARSSKSFKQIAASIAQIDDKQSFFQPLREWFARRRNIQK